MTSMATTPSFFLWGGVSWTWFPGQSSRSQPPAQLWWQAHATMLSYWLRGVSWTFFPVLVSFGDPTVPASQIASGLWTRFSSSLGFELWHIAWFKRSFLKYDLVYLIISLKCLFLCISLSSTAVLVRKLPKYYDNIQICYKEG
jgi:hypothetical protein